MDARQMLSSIHETIAGILGVTGEAASPDYY
jgi:hypothetical protein